MMRRRLTRGIGIHTSLGLPTRVYRTYATRLTPAAAPGLLAWRVRARHSRSSSFGAGSCRCLRAGTKLPMPLSISLTPMSRTDAAMLADNTLLRPLCPGLRPRAHAQLPCHFECHCTMPLAAMLARLGLSAHSRARACCLLRGARDRLPVRRVEPLAISGATRQHLPHAERVVRADIPPSSLAHANTRASGERTCTARWQDPHPHQTEVVAAKASYGVGASMRSAASSESS